MNLDQVYKHILKNPQSYPGLHLKPNLNKFSKQELDSLSQFHIVIDHMIENVHLNLLKGKSVFIKGNFFIQSNFIFFIVDFF